MRGMFKAMPRSVYAYFVCLFCLALLQACSAFARRERSADEIAAESMLLSKKTALLERENEVLRGENLELTRSMEMQDAEHKKKQTELNAIRERLQGQLKSAETSIKNLSDKIEILESESGGKIRQLNALNEQLSKKAAEDLKNAQDDLTRTQLQNAKEKERMSREAAEKQFALGKEVQELKQRIADKEKEAEGLRKEMASVREAQAKLEQELLRYRAPSSPFKK